jgi:hypothetical protein
VPPLPIAPPPFSPEPPVFGWAPLAPDEPGISTLSELAPQPAAKIDAHTHDRTERWTDSRIGDLRSNALIGVAIRI